MSKQAIGREQVHEAAWGREAYPHPIVSCMMPIITLLVVVVLVILSFTIWQKSLPGNVNIPKVIGVPLDEAENHLKDAGLDYDVLKDQQPSETVPAGAVIASVPAEGREVKEGRKIRLLVSAGSQYTKMPNIINRPQSDARTMLAEARLLITNEVSQFDEKVPIDYIIATAPKPGSKVLKNSSVKIVISRGSRADFELGSTPETQDTHSTPLVINIPTDASGPADVHIEVTDDNGTRTVYRQEHNAGDQVVENIEGEGETTAKVFFGSRLLLTKKL